MCSCAKDASPVGHSYTQPHKGRPRGKSPQVKSKWPCAPGSQGAALTEPPGLQGVGPCIALGHPCAASTQSFLCSRVSSVGDREAVEPGRTLQAATPWCWCANARTRAPTRTHTDSPSPAAASAVSCGRLASTWPAGGRPLCRCTCPRCPGRSCTPASSPQGWWATPGGGQWSGGGGVGTGGGRGRRESET